MRRLHGATYSCIGLEPEAIIEIIIAADRQSLSENGLQRLRSPVVIVDGGSESEALAFRNEEFDLSIGGVHRVDDREAPVIGVDRNLLVSF